MPSRFGQLKAAALTIAIVILGLVIVNVFDVFSLARKSLSPIEQPVRELIYGNELSRDTNTLLNQVAELQSLQEENEQLRKLLEFKDRADVRTVSANVVSYDPVVPTIVTIDRGSDDSVLKGDAALNGDGVLVGKVLSVSRSSSEVELLTSESIRVAVSKIDSSETIGIVRGYLNTGVQLEFVPTEVNLSVGDILVTSGIEAQVPEDLLVGEVIQVEIDSEELFGSALLRPMNDLQRLRLVLVAVR